MIIEKMRIRELWVQGLLFLAILMAMPMAELGAQEENGTTEKEETNDKPKKKIKAYEKAKKVLIPKKRGG